MSAWLVSDGHIDTLVQASVVAGQTPIAEATELGVALLRENYLSLAARYGDPVPETISYSFLGVEAPLDPRIVRGAIASWQYQSCEHEAFVESAAFQLMAELAEALEDGTEFDGRGWSIESIVEAVLTEEAA